MEMKETQVVDADPEEAAGQATALDPRRSADLAALVAAADNEEALYLEPETRALALEEILRVQRDLEMLTRAAQEADELERAQIFLLRRERKETVTVEVEIDALVLFTRYLREAG